MNSVEAMETEILKHEGTVLMEIDVSNPLLHSIQNFYNVTQVPYLILMKNYDILFSGQPQASEVHDVLAQDDHRVPVIQEKTKTTVETKLDGGIKKIITTNTSTFTEPELLIEIQPEEYDIMEWFNDFEAEPEEVAITTTRIKSALPSLHNVKDENINL